MYRVLIIDDEKSIRTTLSAFLQAEGYRVDVAEDVRQAKTLLDKKEFDVVVTDIILPRISGIELLQQVHKMFPDILVIIMTGEPTVDTAVEAVRAGAFDYLTKPISKPAILHAVANAAKIKTLEDDKRRLETENLQYRQSLEQQVEKRTRELHKALDKVKKAQQQLVKQERMNAIGEMASGIAHDFNNVLMPIAGFSDMLLSRPNILDDREQTIRMLETIRSASDDARHIVQRLRQIYKEDQPECSPVNLARVMESTISITMPKWKEEMNAMGVTVELVTEFDDVPLIEGNVSDLREVFTNLVFNAVDAMPDGGKITMKIFKENGKGVVCEVCDTGIGMDRHAAGHCLEPFFTTKGASGTGLGLSMVQAIVQRHGGSLKIDSKQDAGTTVRMRFPVSTDVVNGEYKPEADPGPFPPARVLVVDDEVRSRTLVAGLLEADGHDIKMAESGQEGLEIIREENFDLVIMDRAMPLISGDDVALELKKIRPGTPVIMLTGFGEIMKDNSELPPGVSRVMTKPVTGKDLRCVMWHVMNNHRQIG